MVAVGVVFTRTTAVIFYLVEVDWHTHLHTEAEHVRNFLALVCRHLLGNFYCSLVVNDVSQG